MSRYMTPFAAARLLQRWLSGEGGGREARCLWDGQRGWGEAKLSRRGQARTDRTPGLMSSDLQSPSLSHPTFRRREGKAIHCQPDEDDHEHDGDHLAHVVELSAHGECLT